MIQVHPIDGTVTARECAEALQAIVNDVWSEHEAEIRYGMALSIVYGPEEAARRVMAAIKAKTEQS